MDENSYMQKAILEALAAQSEGGAPIASVMVYDDEIISTGVSMVGSETDPSSHNDINCIRAACRKLKRLDLAGCTMYSTIEPCSMCLSAAAWAGLPHIVFGAYQKDIAGNPYVLTGYHAVKQAGELVLPNRKKMSVRGGILQRECTALLSGYRNWMPAA